MSEDKNICPDCMGNGYRRIWKDQHEKEKITIQCKRCDSSGELPEEVIRYEEHDEAEYEAHLKKFFKGRLHEIYETN